MGRPLKNTADWFKHDMDMRNNRKVKALRAKFGCTGYAVFCMTLEQLSDSDNLVIEVKDDVELSLIAGDFGVSEDDLKAIWGYCHRVKLLNYADGQVFCFALTKRFENLFLYRQKRKEAYKKKISDSQNPNETDFVNEKTIQNIVSPMQNPVSNEFRMGETMQNDISTVQNIGETDFDPFESTQSRVEESRVDKSREEKNKNKKEEKESSTDVEAQKEKKGDYISNLISRFQYEYQESRRREYVITNQGMERQAIGRLVGWWKKGHPENDSRQTAEGLQEFFKKCLAVSDQWHYDRISPAHIWSKLNELEIIINKTGAKNNGRTYREISVDELA